MKIRRNFPPLAGISVLAVILITSLALTPPTSAVAPDPGPSARGSGEFSILGDQLFRIFRYSFDVRANDGGHAAGVAEFDNLNDGTEVIVKVKCLRVESFEAIMTGFVVHSDDPNFPVHSNVIFGAIDADLNGEGGPDFIMPLFLLPVGDCHTNGPPLTRTKQPNEAIQIEP